MKLLESIDFWDRPHFVLGVLERGEGVDEVMCAIGELVPMDQVLLLAQVANANTPELQGRVDEFLDQAHERYLLEDG